MTPEIKSKIEAKYPMTLEFDGVRVDNKNFDIQRNAAKYGYSLAEQEMIDFKFERENLRMQIGQRQKEIERLKALIEKMYNNYEQVCPANIKWEQFKKQNNV